MQYKEFLGQVQSRGRMDSLEAATKATRVTLETLSERLAGKEPQQLASQLPEEIAVFLHSEGKGESFDLNAFFHRISQKEQLRRTDAQFHAQAVMDVLQDAVAQGEINDLKSQLPEDFAPLFERVTPNE